MTDDATADLAAAPPPSLPPSTDVPSLAVRWEGLVLTVDSTTLNTFLRRATRGVREIRDILIEPEDGLLGISVRIRKGLTVPFRGHFSSFRLKDGLLGFRLVDLTAFGFVPIPNWLIRRVVHHQPPGRVIFYREERIFVIDLKPYLPGELSLHIRDVVCENGEMKLFFGPSHYRLDRLLEELDR